MSQLDGVSPMEVKQAEIQLRILVIEGLPSWPYLMLKIQETFRGRAPVKNDYNRRSNAYAEIKETVARVIRLFKDTAALLEFALFPFSFAWTTFDTVAKLETLFSDTNATQEVMSDFERSRFGKKLLAFHPSLSFREITEDDPTVHNLYGLETTQIRDLVAVCRCVKTIPRAEDTLFGSSVS